jgi:hypothetical protein
MERRGRGRVFSVAVEGTMSVTIVPETYGAWIFRDNLSFPSETWRALRLGGSQVP